MFFNIDIQQGRDTFVIDSQMIFIMFYEFLKSKGSKLQNLDFEQHFDLWDCSVLTLFCLFKYTDVIIFMPYNPVLTSYVRTERNRSTNCDQKYQKQCQIHY